MAEFIKSEITKKIKTSKTAAKFDEVWSLLEFLRSFDLAAEYASFTDRASLEKKNKMEVTVEEEIKTAMEICTDKFDYRKLPTEKELKALDDALIKVKAPQPGERPYERALFDHYSKILKQYLYTNPDKVEYIYSCMLNSSQSIMEPEVGEAPKDSDDMKFAKAIIEKNADFENDEFAYLLNEGKLKIFTFEKDVSDCINYILERSNESLLYIYFRYLYSETNDCKVFFEAFEEYVMLHYLKTSFSTQHEVDETFARLEALYIVAALNYPVDEANFRKRYRLPPKTKANELPLKCFMANRLFNMHLEEYLARTESSLTLIWICNCRR